MSGNDIITERPSLRQEIDDRWGDTIPWVKPQPPENKDRHAEYLRRRARQGGAAWRARAGKGRG